MTFDESVTTWLAGVKVSDESAVQRLWERYFYRLIELARSVLQSTPRRVADEEDVALSAFKSFCLRAAAGRFPRLDDRDDLWKLLMTITVRKALHVRRKHAGPHAPQDFPSRESQIVGDEPSPDVAALVAEEFRRLLKLLDEAQLRSVALAKFEGYTNREIAQQMGRSVTHVERKLRVIRQIWSEEVTGHAS